MSWQHFVVGFLLLSAFQSAFAINCSNERWDLSEKSLQEARRRIKSDAHPGSTNRVKCALDIISVVGENTRPEGECVACRNEYIGLQKDMLVFIRDAARRAKSANRKTEYYELEVKTRVTFGEYLISLKDPNLINLEWSDNFEGLGDAMEKARMGRDFHEYVILANNLPLTEKSYKSWSRAVRSCDAWNFVGGDNNSIVTLRPKLLCNEDCRIALETIRARAAEDVGPNSAAIRSLLDNRLPKLDECPTGTRP